MKPCGGCAKRREMLKAALAAARAKLARAKPIPAKLEEKRDAQAIIVRSDDPAV